MTTRNRDVTNGLEAPARVLVLAASAMLLEVAACGTDLEDCPFSADYACYQCPGGTLGEDYQLACRARLDCAVFCGPLPNGYARCSYEGPNLSEEQCLGLPEPPRGSFSVCHPAGGDGRIGPLVACPTWCLAAVAAVIPAIGPDGKCVEFANSCTPAGYTDGREDPRCHPGAQP